MGDRFADVAASGPLLLALGAAALAGLVSFLSPCVLPLVPGYLSYVTGLAGADLDAALGVRPGASASGHRPETSADRPETTVAAQAPTATPPTDRPVATVAVAAPPATAPAGGRRRVLAGTALFVLGFTVVYTVMAILLSRLYILLGTYRRPVDVAVGLLVIVFGLAFLGLIPGVQRELRVHRLPSAGLIGAPVLGAVFALSWTPCLGPTLGAVQGLASTTGQVDRAAVLAVAYCLGLGVPFVVFGLLFRRLLGVFRVIRRHSRWVTRIGGALLIVMGLTMVAGGWGDLNIWLLTTFDVSLDPGTLL